jgi:diguanylate cyclase (GGDEF)-like protein
MHFASSWLMGSGDRRPMTRTFRYSLLGVLVGLVAPAGLLVYAQVASRSLDPLPLFLTMAAGGTVTFAIAGWMIARRDEALDARNERLALISARFESLATIDALTGLPNRRSFDERLAEEMGRSLRYEVPLALVMVDLDRFKAVNDRHGHRAGDQVLARVAQTLDRGKRAGDTVARYGGEEFVALLPHSDAAAATAWAERARARIAAQTVPWGSGSLSITASFGVAMTPGNGDTAVDLVEAADRALYAAKQQGRNQVAVAPTAEKARRALVVK